MQITPNILIEQPSRFVQFMTAFDGEKGLFFLGPGTVIVGHFLKMFKDVGPDQHVADLGARINHLDRFGLSLDGGLQYYLGQGA